MQKLLFFISFITLFSCNGMEVNPSDSLITIITSDKKEFNLSKNDAQKLGRIEELLEKRPKSYRIKADKIDSQTFEYIFYHLTNNEDRTFTKLSDEELSKLLEACERLNYAPMAHEITSLVKQKKPQDADSPSE